MSTRTHTPAAPSPAREPGRRKTRRSRWPVVAGAVVVLVALAIAAVWFFGRSEPVDIIPAHPDEAAEGPQQPDEVAPEIVYGREPRANWDVTGVAGGDRLNVRTGPGLHHAVMATLAPDAVELESTGRVGRVDGVLWREIVVPGDGTGWVHAGYLTETVPALLDDGRHATYLHGNVNLVRLAEDSDADLDPGTWEELPDYLSGYQPPDDRRLSWNPFWLVVTDRVVTGIEEQYMP